VVALLLTSLAHVTGGGNAPGLPVVLAVAAPVWMFSFWLAGRRLGALMYSALLISLQTLLHTAFMLPDTATANSHGANAMSDHMGAPMLAAHALAAIALGVVLARGEAALDALINVIAKLAHPTLELPRLEIAAPVRDAAVAPERVLVAAQPVCAVGLRAPPAL